MRIERQISRAERVVVFRLTGEVADEDLLAFVEQVRKDRDVTPDYSALVDLTDADARRVTARGIRQLAKTPLVLDPRSRRAVVILTLFGYGLARMYQLLRGDSGGPRIFRDFDVARRWVATGADSAGA